MRVRHDTPRGRVPLLDLEPRLGRGLSRSQSAQARREITAPVSEVAEGPWSPLSVTGVAIRILVAEGLLLRSFDFDGMTASEPLAERDVLGRTDLMLQRAVLGDGRPLLPGAFSWQAVTPVTLAVLDPVVMQQLARWPSIRMELSLRAAARTQRGALLNAIMHRRSAADRLWLTLLLLGENWGTRADEGIIIPFVLTHAALGQLIGADRPTVSIALKELRTVGAVEVMADRRLQIRTGDAR